MKENKSFYYNARLMKKYYTACLDLSFYGADRTVIDGVKEAVDKANEVAIKNGYDAESFIITRHETCMVWDDD